MSGSNRQLYLTATVLNQAFLDATAMDNLDTRLEMVVDIETSTGFIRASDRNKYVGGTFYEALLTFPTINRKISHWLQNQIEFSSLTLELSNVDARYNNLELAGADYNGFIGKTIDVSIGLRDVASTYTKVFSGVVTDIGGFGRTTKSLIFTARDVFDKINTNLPSTALNAATFPNIETDKLGLSVPVIYGDWTTVVKKATIPAHDLTPLSYLETADIPAFCTNGILALSDPVNNAAFIISDNANQSFDSSNVWLFRGDQWTLFDPADIVSVSVDNRMFEIVQNGVTQILPPPGADGSPEGWQYSSSDNIFTRVMGKPLPGGLNSNIILQVQDILTTFGGFSPTDFDASWAYFAAKTSPAESAVANIPSRVWVQEVQAAMQYGLSMLAQVRLEAFVNRDQKLQLNSQHFEEWEAASTFVIKNWDVVKDSFRPALDNQNNFNRARGVFNRSPVTNETTFATGFYNNAAAVTQAGKQITKQVTFPNLYIASDVANQLIEILKLASAQSELITMTLTSRSFLKELGDWVRVSVKIGSTVFDNVPAQVREVGYDPQGLKIPVVLWSMQSVPFPGWTPGYAGVVGGYSATITAE